MKNALSYQREVIYKDKRVERVLITWPVGSKSLPHDHGKSRGRIRVIYGEVYENVFDKKTKKFLWQTFNIAGSFFEETPEIIHVMGNAGPHEAKTEHEYRPPLKMRNYSEKELQY